MTPDEPKCEHRDKEGDMDLGWTDAGEVSCLACGQRFVPSDVLEEAREFVSNCVLEDEAHDFFGSPASRLLARIDGVLGR